MSHLAKLNLKTVQRNVQKDPVIARREKLLAGVAEQQKVLAAALSADEYTVKTKRWQTNDAGERVLVEHDKRVRAWFFEQDNGWYVQCRYGSRILNINGKSNAVFVDKLEGVAAVLEAFKAAAESGELDKAVVLATKARSS
ncbi:hypothetical protein [Sulfitobacter mediterraneus]|uniref:Uncharacterized protein n=1 Tax=Sulfitobacter mediterraneus TaxID=83219 RepID=A0A2T6CDG4_9RHOB|nr:hypothetical protein [Sulfitobacter mediterraneus]KIN79472.1 hypothetical protein Z950_3 [Sulfitobacter mediterraneus KCTC 32188]PTX73534.1 hypothetical protein C8N31_107237 [Sulfitobacter mediterraneus]